MPLFLNYLYSYAYIMYFKCLVMHVKQMKMSICLCFWGVFFLGGGGLFVCEMDYICFVKINVNNCQSVVLRNSPGSHFL